MRPLRIPRAVVWASLVAGAGCASLLSHVGFKRDQIASQHARHAEAKVECITCHEPIYDAETLEAEALPREATCLQCHKEWKAAGNCSPCHAQPDAPATYVRGVSAPEQGDLRMSHVKHLELTNEDCGVCHQRLPDSRPLEGSSVPMAACTNCHPHDGEFGAAQCTACHTDLNRYALRPITSYSHKGDYLQRHAQDAHAGGASCGTCHEQTFCSDCHTQTVPAMPEVMMAERVDRRFVHGREFYTRHSIDAQASAPLCASCHSQTFCDSCHQREGLSARSENALNPHPPGFNSPGSPVFHGPAARRNIETCAACHDQGAQSNCVECHRVGGIGGNPHPSSWLVRHPIEEVNRNAMCLACHP
jgi:hypothetical protein